jgi:CheY-like chemotaxis protein
MNLVINGAEAIDGAGIVRITTELRELSATDMQKMEIGADQPPGRYAALIVQDTGHGMDELTKARIFDPFFSTRFTGRGLGLAAVNGIIRAHRGALKLDTTLHAGTTFTIFWPLATAPDVSDDPPLPSPSTVTSQPETTPGDGRMVLLVDDEPQVRQVAQRMLRRLGFTVHEAENSDIALQLMQEYGSQIVLALIDLTMPGMTGDELATTLLEQFPTLRIILMSGFSQQELPPHLRTSGRVSFLAKPFTLTTLTAAVTTALSSHTV